MSRSWPTVEELREDIRQEIDSLKESIKAYEEQLTERQALRDDGKTVDQRTIECLDRQERFAGEHQMARAWLKTSKTARIWTVRK